MISYKPAFILLLLTGCIVLGLQVSPLVLAEPDAVCGHGDAPPLRPGQGGPEHPGMREQEPNPPFLHGVELTDAQQDKIFEIIHKQEPLVREQAKAAHKAHDALRTMAASGQYEDAKARALAVSGARAMAEMALQNARSDQQIYALLTPEQRQQAEAMKSKLEPRFEPRGMPEYGLSRSIERPPRAVPKVPTM